MHPCPHLWLRAVRAPGAQAASQPGHTATAEASGHQAATAHRRRGRHAACAGHHCTLPRPQAVSRQRPAARAQVRPCPLLRTEKATRPGAAGARRPTAPSRSPLFGARPACYSAPSLRPLFSFELVCMRSDFIFLVLINFYSIGRWIHGCTHLQALHNEEDQDFATILFTSRA